jgi:ankyrin repeat protein
LSWGNIEAKNKKGDTPLHKTAVSQQSLETVRELIRLSANVDAENYNKETPLYLAVSEDYSLLEIVRELVRLGQILR